MNGPVRHHFVPDFYLKNFSDDGERVWMHKIHEKPIHIATEEIAFENDMYTRKKDGRKDVSNEILLGKIEDLAAPIIRKIIEDESFNNLSPHEKDDFAAFVILLSERNPRNFEIVDKMMRHVHVDEYRRVIEKLTDEELRNIYEKAVRDNPELSDVSFAEAKKLMIEGPKAENVVFSHSHGLQAMWQAAHECIDFLLRRDWHLVEPIQEEDIFVLSDDPVLLLFADDEGVTMSKGGWGRKSLEVVLPLSPKLLFYASYQIEDPDVELNSEEVSFINKLSITQSNRYYISDRLDPPIID